MVPVIVQDYRTDEVLMLAYMNELAFNTTLEAWKNDITGVAAGMSSGPKV